MGCMFNKITVNLRKPLSLKEKIKRILHDIGVEWYMNKFNEKLPPLN